MALASLAVALSFWRSRCHGLKAKAYELDVFEGFKLLRFFSDASGVKRIDD